MRRRGTYPRPRVATMPMRLITLHLPQPYIKALDGLVKAKLYPNRAEAIRHAVRDLLNKEVWSVHPVVRSL